jgi:hypothetical protein
MPGSLSDYCEAKLLNHVFGGIPWNPLPIIYLGYMVGVPSELGQGAEPIGGGYQRIAINNNLVNFPSASNQIKTMATEQTFEMASNNHGTVQAIAGFDSPAPGTGNMLFYAPIAQPTGIQPGDSFRVLANSLQITIQPGGGFSNYSKNALLDHLLGGTTFNLIPNLYFGYMTTAPSDAAAGTEASGGGYGRVAVVNNPTNFPEIVPGPSSVKINAYRIDFTEATANQGTVGYVGVWDAASAGNFICWYQMAQSKIITIEHIPFIAEQDFKVTLD